MTDLIDEKADAIEARLEFIVRELSDILNNPHDIRAASLNNLLALFPEALAQAMSLDDLHPVARDAFRLGFEDLSREGWAEFLSTLSDASLARLLAAYPTTHEGRKNSRLAVEVQERMSRDEAQALYHFGVLVTKLYS